MDTKKGFNLKLEPELIRQMKIQAAMESRTISEIATDLFREYLKKAKPKK
jgi:hypothetical protein